MQDWGAWVRGQRNAMTIWYDPKRSIRIWCLHEDDGLSFPYRLQKFPLFLSSSYRLQKFADTDRLRVNRRPIRKDFFPDRYDFVPIVFTSSSCKRGLSLQPCTCLRAYQSFKFSLCSGTQHFSAAVWYPLCKNIFSGKKNQKDKTSEPKFQSLFVCLFIDMF